MRLLSSKSGGLSLFSFRGTVLLSVLVSCVTVGSSLLWASLG